jgi:hypothetical protein
MRKNLSIIQAIPVFISRPPLPHLKVIVALEVLPCQGLLCCDNKQTNIILFTPSGDENVQQNE